MTNPVEELKKMMAEVKVPTDQELFTELTDLLGDKLGHLELEHRTSFLLAIAAQQLSACLAEKYRDVPEEAFGMALLLGTSVMANRFKSTMVNGISRCLDQASRDG